MYDRLNFGNHLHMHLFNPISITNQNNSDYHLKDINWDGQSFGYSLLMINDHQRNQFYQAALGDVTDKTVLDIGTGTGLLSVIAVQQGAKKVYAIERNRRNYELAKHFIEQSGLSDRIELICADILSIDQKVWKHDTIDVTITETFANDCFIENFAFLVEHVERTFNLSPDHRWIPDNISLKLALVDIPPLNEFDPGVNISDEYCSQINNAIQIYRNSLYHKYDIGNMPVAQIPRLTPEHMTQVDSYFVNCNLRSYLDSFKYYLTFDHTSMKDPYLKVEWVLHSNNIDYMLNRSPSWRSIAFKIDPAGSSEFYFRFNPYSHALLGSQV